jgi:SOS-response transcriptional repressor LexA
LQHAYLLKDISGRDLWLEVDGSTWKDGNITVGDMIVAQTDATDSFIRARSLSKR